MYVWRVEAENGDGPFNEVIWELPDNLSARASAMTGALDARWYRRTNPKMPANFQSGIHKCGFRSKRQLLTYFTPKALRILAKHGYEAKRMHIPDDKILITDDQVAFDTTERW